jgi:hypothetical protein
MRVSGGKTEGTLGMDDPETGVERLRRLTSSNLFDEKR